MKLTPNDIEMNQPTNARATSDGNTITLMWDWPSSIPTTGWRVYRSLTGGEPWPRPDGGKFTGANYRQFNDTGGPDNYTLIQNQDYHYYVQPYYLPPGSEERRGELSKHIIIQLGDNTHKYPQGHLGPTNLVATHNGSNVSLSWDWVNAPHEIGGFKFERKTDDGGWQGDDWTTERKISNPNARTFVDNYTDQNHTYLYRCFGYNGDINYGFSEYSVAYYDSVTPPPVNHVPPPRNSSDVIINVGTNYSGTTTNTLNIINVPSSFNGKKYYCAVKNIDGSIEYYDHSNNTKLNVT